LQKEKHLNILKYKNKYMVVKMKTQNKIEKIKGFILNHKFLLALLVLDLIPFVYAEINPLMLNSSLMAFVVFLFITSTYLIVLFEKHVLEISLIGIIFFIFSFFGGLVIGGGVIFGLIIYIVLFIFPQSFLLVIFKHFKLFDKQNIIVKTIILDAIILIPIFMLFGFGILSIFI